MPLKTRIEYQRTGTRILVTDDWGRTKQIIEPYVKEGCEQFSIDELKEIARQIEEQLKRMEPWSIFPEYQNILIKVEGYIYRKTIECARPVCACCCPCRCPREGGFVSLTFATMPSKSPTRLYRGPNQVLCKEQLRLGQTYFSYTVPYTSDLLDIQKFVIIRGPYFAGEDWYIDVEAEKPVFGQRTLYYSLADHSIVPHKDGQWGTRRYILFTKSSCMPCMPVYSNCCCHSYHPCHHHGC